MYSSKTHYLLMSQRPFTERKLKRSCPSKPCNVGDYPNPSEINSGSTSSHINKKTSFIVPETKGEVNPQTTKGMNPLKCSHSQKDYYLKRNKYPIIETSSDDLYHRGAMSKSEYIQKKRYQTVMLDKNIIPPNEYNTTKSYTKSKFVSFTNTNKASQENVYNNLVCNNNEFNTFRDC